MGDTKPSTDPTIIFVLGLLSMVFCQLLGPVALIMGNKYRAECKSLGVEPEGLGTAGWVLGIVGTLFLGLGLVGVVLYVVLVVVAVAAGAM